MPNSTNKNSSLFSTIVVTGLVAAVLDISAACLQYYISTGKDPGNVLRFVASGVFGKKAFAGGTTMALWGLLFHFVITYALTLFFFWLYPRITWIRNNIVLAGLLYGIFAWIITTLLIVPLSNTPPQPFILKNGLIAISILMLCIGLPIALLTNKYYLYKK